MRGESSEILCFIGAYLGITFKYMCINEVWRRGPPIGALFLFCALTCAPLLTLPPAAPALLAPRPGGRAVFFCSFINNCSAPRRLLVRANAPVYGGSKYERSREWFKNIK